MAEPTYETIFPLLEDVRVQRRTASARFVCRQTGDSVQARFTLPESTGSLVAQRVGRTVGRSLMWSLRSSIYGIVRGIFGHGMLARITADLVGSAVTEVQRRQGPGGQDGLDEDETQAALVEAFKTVQGRFVWVPAQGRWVSTRAAEALMPPFQRQLAQHPVSHPYDRQVLARMLVELARADGQLASQEQDLLTELIEGGVEDLAERPPLTGAELGTTSSGDTRVSLLLTAWTLALVDEEMDERERTLLMGWADGLDLRPAQVVWVRNTAQHHVLEEALERMHTWGGHDSYAREQLYDLAQRLGMSRPEAEKAEAAFQRRKAEQGG